MPPPEMGVIKLWAWDDAPEKYKALSHNGGDEDWVMHIPQDFIESWGDADECGEFPDVEFLDVRLWHITRQLGVCRVEYHQLPGLSCIAIGAHS